MRIEKLGVVITDVPFIAPIKISECVMTIGERAVSRAEIEQMRDALTAALAEYDAMTDAATEQPAPSASAFTVGQVLIGDENLPVGTVVRDKDGDPWAITADCPLNNIRKHWAPFEIERLP